MEYSTYGFGTGSTTPELATKYLGKNGTALPHKSSDAWWNMFVCLTTANHPDVFMAVYDESRFSILVVASYMVCTNMIGLNLLLAVVTSEFSEIMDKRNEARFKKRLAMIDTAFEMLADDTDEAGQMAISPGAIRKCLETIARFDNSQRHRQLDEAEIASKVKYGGEHFRQDCDWIDLTTSLLDSDGSKTIGPKEFRQLSAVFQFPMRIRKVESIESQWEEKVRTLEAQVKEGGVGALQVREELAETAGMGHEMWAARYKSVHWFVNKAGYGCFTFHNVTASFLIITVVVACAFVDDIRSLSLSACVLA